MSERAAKGTFFWHLDADWKIIGSVRFKLLTVVTALLYVYLKDPRLHYIG